jgi:hypothetical protein
MTDHKPADANREQSKGNKILTICETRKIIREAVRETIREEAAEKAMDAEYGPRRETI